MLSFWAGGISSFSPCAREYRLLRRLYLTVNFYKVHRDEGGAYIVKYFLKQRIARGTTYKTLRTFKEKNSAFIGELKSSPRFCWQAPTHKYKVHKFEIDPNLAKRLKVRPFLLI